MVVRLVTLLHLPPLYIKLYFLLLHMCYLVLHENTHVIREKTQEQSRTKAMYLLWWYVYLLLYSQEIWSFITR
jgi:hypothetical protein